jgi:putative membrane-bound dehydrogenase-like protein
MKRMTASDPIAFRLLVVLVFYLTASAGLSGETISLFDGSTLDGWEGDPEHWRVEGGAIVGEIPAGATLRKNTWLVWKAGTLEDFDLRVKVKLTGAAAANSGIQFRCQVDGIEHVSGYQADLDQGATWLGRIYDEHGRALLVERGSRVLIRKDGTRRVQTFAPANQYAVLFREKDWNDYRIVAIGDHIAVYINGTLFSELKDQQEGERDLSGSLAVQLHSGPETRVEFRDFQLERLHSNDDRLGEFSLPEPDSEPESAPGISPKNEDGADLNLGFEQGRLVGWTATGDAFDGQPVNEDGIASRWPGQSSNKQGEFFIGGYEKVQDRGTGTLTSEPFRVTHPFGSFLIGGGSGEATRVELMLMHKEPTKAKVIHQSVGNQREQMRRVVVDLRPWQGQQIAIRLVDDNAGGWGHLNFDDFRFHEVPPVVEETSSAWRSIQNPLLQHLVPNPVDSTDALPGTPANTLSQMFVPRGFSVDLIAAEPELHQPMAFTFDVKGRLWVAEGYCYPQKRPPGEGLDRILIFTDTDGDGSFDNRKVFIEGLNLVSGMEVGHGGVWVGAAPELLFIPDRDGDDRPDGDPEALLDGFGYADTHETLNSFLWGPDGWLYGNQGVFNSSRIGKPGCPDSQRQSLSAGVWRYHPTRHLFEVFAHGGSNQWGLDYDQQGQLFMTHCRSYWGRGSTTHVIQGAHYWNQVNGGYAPFVSSVAPPNQPGLRNYLLASARYGHGEGGAGKPGSRQVYGGHSHVGTMIYLGDNWPEQYRNHLFTHNLHGHQMNQQVNLRHAGGYRTVHAGYEPFFCADPQYIGVDLMVGPDGAVYFSDWYDPRHCHNPNVEQWDRGNGRVYRMKHDANYHPAQVDYSTASDEQLVEAQLHANEWHGRAARLVMHERASANRFSPESVARLRAMVLEHPSADGRLRGLWSLHLLNELDLPLVNQLLTDESEYVRAWTIQLAVESLPADALAAPLQALTEQDSSLLVRRYLASAIQRLPAETGWSLATALATRSDTQRDRELTLLLWYAIASSDLATPATLLPLAEVTQVPDLRSFLLWYAAKQSEEGREAVAQRLTTASDDEQIRYLELLELAVRGMRGQSAPAAWLEKATELYESSNDSIRSLAESVGAIFGDQRLFERMRKTLSSEDASPQARQHALAILELDPSAENLPVLLRSLDREELTDRVIPMLMRYDDSQVAKALLARFKDWPAPLKSSAMAVLVSRSVSAHQILDAMEAGELPVEDLTAFHARQIFDLGDEPLRRRLAEQWGSLGQSSEARKQEITALVGAYRSAPLWAYNAQAGAAQFKKLCAACHEPNPQGETVAPKLAGSGSKGIEYLVENILDPNAVIGRDFLARNVLTSEGLVISGLIENETDSAITIRTLTDSVTLAKEDIEAIRVSTNSFMPEGLLAPLNDREKLELLKYLMSL